jgi:DNA-binding MarR family transcriptional regulator
MTPPMRVKSLGLSQFSSITHQFAIDSVVIAYTLHIVRCSESAWGGIPYKRRCETRRMNQVGEFPLLLRAAYFAMHRASDSHFTRYGITADQFVVLACLRENDAVMQQDLVRRAASDPSTIRAMLVLLEGRGLVIREPHPVDRRAREVSLTAKGRRLCERLWRSSDPIRIQLLAGFSEEESQTLLGFLQRVIQNTASIEKRLRRSSPRTPKVARGTI